jgi:1-acyl-sn-glycerol-3-phosphate acyltransferase
MRTFVRALTWCMALVMRLLYGFRVEGLENLPVHGPYLLLMNEIGFMGAVASAMTMARLTLTGRTDEPCGMAVEDVLTWGPFSRFVRAGMVLPIPPGYGQNPASLWAGLKALREGRIVTINPDGEMSWDGQPPPLKAGASWLALRSGVRLVPLVVTAGAYDVWPRWAELPRLTGRFTVRIGAPFTLRGAPVEQVDERLLQETTDLIAARLQDLIYNEHADLKAWEPPLAASASTRGGLAGKEGAA